MSEGMTRQSNAQRVPQGSMMNHAAQNLSREKKST
jgi:hypothetical protein